MEWSMNLNGLNVTWEEDIEAISDCIFTDEDIEDVEGDLIEEIAHDLEDERSAIVGWGECSDISREYEFLEYVTHGCYLR